MTALGFKCSESLTLYSTSPRTTLSLRLWFSHMRTFLACVIKHSASSVFLFSWRESLLCNDNLPPPPTPTTTVPLRRTKVRGHCAGSRLSSWHREVRAARKSGAWGSVSSTCRNTTFSSCWRTALSSCALPGPTGLWRSSGSTLRGWKRFVCTNIYLHFFISQQNSFEIVLNTHFCVSKLEVA